jgi:hypothetical protein
MSRIPLFVLSFLLCAMSASRSLATVYDAAADFSASSNPNAPWQYGSEITLGGAFTLHANAGVVVGLDYWDTTNGSSMSHNATGSTITGGSWNMLAGELGMHPGITGQFSIVRFVAPSSGPYDLDARFYGRDFQGPTSTDVHVVVNGAPVFSAIVNSFRGAGQSYSTSMTLAAGDLVDFAVGWGPNANYGFDSTGLEATMEFVPEPGTLLLLGAGTTGLAAIGRRKK